MSTADSPSEPVIDGFDLKDRVAIVTGASSGLGERFARVLAANGAKVYAAARRRDRLDALASSAGVTPMTCDVADFEACAQLVRDVYADAGKVDILVNNAGYGRHVPAEQETAEAFRAMLDVNLVAPFVLSQQVVAQAPGPLEGVSIINIASILGTVGNGRLTSAGYAASKGGVVNLTRELAAQWARRGVRVNALAPGWFRSEATADLFANEKPAAWVNRLTPMGRPGEQHELDGALRFLASDASSFMTGQVLVVDGGWTSV